jgi:RNA polymerase sigma-70 factor, ECF subfamily
MGYSVPEMPEDATTITGWLMEWRQGSRDAGDRLFAASYQALRRLAAWHLRNERPGHTLQPTALVHELYLRLFQGEPVEWQNRAHFLAVAAQQLRRLLIDHARARLAEKREGHQVRLSLTDVGGLAEQREEDLIEVDEALQRLEELDSRSARVVELRFFGGLTEQEAAEAIGISVATLKRDWDFARAWLVSQLADH